MYGSGLRFWSRWVLSPSLLVWSGLRGLFGEFGDGLRHAVHLQASEHDDDGSAGRTSIISTKTRGIGLLPMQSFPSLQFNAN